MYARTNKCYNERGSITNYVRSSIAHFISNFGHLMRRVIVYEQRISKVHIHLRCVYCSSFCSFHNSFIVFRNMHLSILVSSSYPEPRNLILLLITNQCSRSAFPVKRVLATARQETCAERLPTSARPAGNPQ